MYAYYLIVHDFLHTLCFYQIIMTFCFKISTLCFSHFCNIIKK